MVRRLQARSWKRVRRESTSSPSLDKTCRVLRVGGYVRDRRIFFALLLPPRGLRFSLSLFRRAANRYLYVHVRCDRKRGEGRSRPLTGLTRVCRIFGGARPPERSRIIALQYLRSIHFTNFVTAIINWCAVFYCALLVRNFYNLQLNAFFFTKNSRITSFISEISVISIKSFKWFNILKLEWNYIRFEN